MIINAKRQVRVIKREGSFEQKSGQTRERELAASISRTTVAAYGVVQLLRASERGRQGRAKRWMEKGTRKESGKRRKVGGIYAT